MVPHRVGGRQAHPAGVVESEQMLTRLFIDNYRCFVNFEFKPSRRQLIFGPNGSGKSSFLDAILFLRQFITQGNPINDYFLVSQRTRWQNNSKMTFELEPSLGAGHYRYALVIEAADEPAKARIALEAVYLAGKPIYEFVKGEVRLYNDQFELKNTFEFDSSRSALAPMVPRPDNQTLAAFKTWAASLYCFRINPYSNVMISRSESEQLYAKVDLSNYASWYRHLLQSLPEESTALWESLRETIGGFRTLQFEPVGENNSVLAAKFHRNGNVARYYFHELSDGQRCLICLYSILHFLVAKGDTVIIDEPENFISLREIQPWLMAVTDAIENGNGQVLLISHHPEIINQWAPAHGVEFVRDENGPTRVAPFPNDSEAVLPPSELIARGWERE